MFLLIATSYWLGFGLLAFALARRSSRLALLLPLLALTPPAFVFVGIIWRDVLFATTWLLAAAIVFAAAERGARFRMSVQALALALCAFGVLLRPNALIAAPILAAYIAWPSRYPGSARRSCSSRRWRDFSRWCKWCITARSARRGSIPCSRS